MQTPHRKNQPGFKPVTLYCEATMLTTTPPYSPLCLTSKSSLQPLQRRKAKVEESQLKNWVHNDKANRPGISQTWRLYVTGTYTYKTRGVLFFCPACFELQLLLSQNVSDLWILSTNLMWTFCCLVLPRGYMFLCFFRCVRVCMSKYYIKKCLDLMQVEYLRTVKSAWWNRVQCVMVYKRKQNQCGPFFHLLNMKYQAIIKNWAYKEAGLIFIQWDQFFLCSTEYQT